jgi:signal transduction histidine kinase
MTPSGYALIGLTVIVAVLAGIVTYAVLRFIAAARDTRSQRHGSAEIALLSAALQEAVAKLKAQEQAMTARAAASEQLSVQIIESLTSGLLVVDRSGRIEMLNLAARRLLGISGDTAAADYHALLAAAPPLVEAIAESLATGRAIVRRTLEMPAALPASHLGVTVSPLTANAGVICLFADLTKVVALEEQLRLKDALARLGELTAGIAHEFRNGLATIHGYSRLIDPEALPAQYKAYLEGIRQEAEALGKVVTNFLSFARPEQVVFARVDLGSIAARAADDLRHELPPETTVEVKGEFGGIQGDEVMLRQTFGNLIRNAAEACHGAGIAPSIVVSGEVDRAQRTCRVAVSDNGPGIRPANRVRIFQPFFTTRAHGTGLGLAIVQKVVVTHGGRIVAASSLTGGASFEMTFPLAEE